MKVLGRRRTYALLALGAAFTALTLIFPQIGLLEWLTLIPVALVLFCLSKQGISLWRAYRYGFFTVFVYYFVIYHWFVYLYPLDFAGLDGAASVAVVLAGWLGLSLLQALPGGLIFLAFVALCRTRAVKRFPLAKPFLLAALWTVFEWSSTLGWTGVPWGRLCLGQTSLLTSLQSASLFGSYFVTFLLVAVNALFAAAILYAPRRALCAVLATVLFACNHLFGLVRISLPRQPESESVGVAVIQGNVDSHDKWDSASLLQTLNTYEGMTRQAAEKGASLVVWPETALPYDLSQNASLTVWLSELSRSCNATLVVGALWTDDAGNEYNSLFLVTPENGFDGSARYDKRHLVPFGEYVPMRALITALIPPLAELSAIDDDLTPGDSPALFETQWGKLGSLICFDSIYEGLALDSVQAGAGLMLISSNDSWFRDSAALRQHLDQARLRAIESGRTYVRAANTGISDVILRTGESTAQIGALEQGYALRTVSFRSDRTLYSYIGNLFVYLCMAFCLAAPAMELVRAAVRLWQGRRKERAD